MTPSISHVLLRDWFSVIAQRNGTTLDGPARALQELSDDVQRGVGDLVYGARRVLERRELVVRTPDRQGATA